MRRVFDGSEIRVMDDTERAQGDTLVITFPARTARQGLHRKAFGNEFLRARGIPAAYVLAETNHWFQTPEADGAIKAVAEIARGFRRVITYGSSMGGYAALSWSKRVGATDVIAISPQFSIDRTRVPWEKRWSEEAAELTFRDDVMANNLSKTAKITIIYDPTTPDLAHARMIQELNGQALPLLVPFGGHPAGTFLRDIGMISETISKLIGGSTDLGSLRRQIRERRGGAASYWSNRATRLGVQKRWEAAIEAGRKAVGLAPQDARVWFAFGRLCIRVNDFDGAVGALSNAVNFNPREPKYQKELDAVLSRRGAAKGA